MKKTIKLIGIIAIIAIMGISFYSCSDPEAGQLTITGLGAYNGKYLIGTGFLDTDNSKMFVAAESIDVNNKTINGVRISRGRVTLNVYELVGDEEDYFDIVPFFGSGFARFILFACTTPTLDPNDEGLDMIGRAEVTFAGGDGTAAILPFLGIDPW